MADFTKKAIRETFLALLEEHPLSSITVKVLVETCGINRNTFYYHYRDLPDLIEEIINDESEMIIREYPSVNTIVECFDALTAFASHRKRAIMHIYSSMSREVFERNLMHLSEYFIRSYLDTVVPEEMLPSADRQTIIGYFKCVGFGLIIDWLNNGMTEEYVRSVRRIFLMKKDFALEIAEILRDQV